MSTPAGLESLEQLHRLIWSAIFAACIAVGAVLHYHQFPIPLTLQSFFVMLAGFSLGAAPALTSVGFYLFSGALGLAVFTMAPAGSACLSGPTGGYLVGLLPLALMCGLASRHHQGPEWTLGLFYGLLGLIAMHSIGAWQFARMEGYSYLGLIRQLLLPYLFPELGKLVAALCVSQAMHHLGFFRVATSREPEDWHQSFVFIHKKGQSK